MSGNRSPGGDSERGEREALAAFRRDLDTHQRLIDELSLVVRGRDELGIPGLSRRVGTIEESVRTMKATQETLQRIHEEEREKRNRHDKYVLGLGVAVIAAVAALLAALIQVLG